MKMLLTLILLLLSYALFSQTNIDSIIIKNKVKEVRILDSKNDTASIARYNMHGKLTYNLLDNFGGSTFLKTSIRWIYNENDQVLKTISTHSSFPDSTVWIYEYDANGNRISTKTGEGKIVFKYYYDNSNFLIKQQSYNDSNNIEQTTTYEKVDDGKKIVSKIVGNFIKDRTNTTYMDDNSNNIKTESYDGDKINFTTNSIFEGNRLKKTIYNSGYGSVYSYDAKGRLIKRCNFKVENGAEKITGFEEFEYNDNGLLTNYQENIYSSGILRKYKYEYDFYQ